MSLTQRPVEQSVNAISGELLEKVMIEQDLSRLTPLEKVQYVKSICGTLGLNPVTKPIQIMKFQNKETPYFTKDATEQLRKINKISINKIETKLHDGNLYVVTAHASTPDGRQDSSTGAIVIGGLKGDALANAMMKAETKAKRRVTLSICGLGFIDESEVDSIPGATKIKLVSEEKQELIANDLVKLDEYLLSISECVTSSDLQSIFTEAYKYFVSIKDKDSLDIIILAKDKKKKEIQVLEFNNEIDSSLIGTVNEITGEVINA